ncbi:MAG: tripartite tricarboxylate transporter substrate binding protein [Reyranella sp.]|nr:tripartite tricarboxylate transporter substrate binding protein [Reyranella sp.]MDP3161565.1 tripartite tricarboxylate transporter substrate binding protein [Reyranella sp.]
MRSVDSTSRFSRRRFARSAVGVAALALLAPAVHAQEAFPTKPLSVVVPMAPGGSTDYLARTVAQQLSETLGKPVVVDNKAGATGAIGTSFVAKAAPDGHTLLVAPSSVVVVNPLISKVPYDVARDFKPVGLLAKVEVIVVAAKDKGFKTLADMIAYAKKNPGKLTYGSNGQGSAFHLAGEMLALQAGIELLHVPYKGASLAEAALLSNEIDIMVTNTISAMPYIKSGKIVPLAIASSSGKSRELPDVPLATETLPGYTADTWLALYAPAGTSDAVVDKLNAAVNAYLRDPQQAAALRSRGMEPSPGTAQDLQRYQAQELAMWTKVANALKAAGRLE